MKYSEWKIWLSSLPWGLRWFPILVLIRPIVDQFWNLKHISPFVSPLYWVGFLTPVLCLNAIGKYSSDPPSGVSKMFRNWSILVVINAILMFLSHFNTYYFALALKLTLPVYLFYFLRVFIQNKVDFLGVLQTFIYSYFIVILFFIYELIFGARSIQYTRGDIERYEGGFADVMNYAIYAIGGVMVVFYFYFLKEGTPLLKKILSLVLTLLCSLLILFKIFHFTSFLAITALVILFFIPIFKKSSSSGLIFVVIIVIIYNLIQPTIEEKVYNNMVQTELQARDEGRNDRRYFNGRMGRWIDRWEEFEKVPVPGKVFGSGITLSATSSLVGIAVHNDFFRMIFFVGFMGFVFYLLFYLQLFIRRKYMYIGERYILDASIALIFIYSMTTLPTLYPPFMYLLLSVFAYASLPDERLYETSKEPTS